MDCIKGEFFLSVVKGFVHHLGNIANGIGINVQILKSKKEVLGEDYKFLQRVEENSLRLNELLAFTSQMFLKQVNELSEVNKELIKKFIKSQAPSVKNQFFSKINWDSIKTVKFYILLSIIFSVFKDLDAEISIYEEKAVLVFHFLSEVNKSIVQVFTNLFDNLKVKYKKQDTNIFVEDL